MKIKPAKQILLIVPVLFFISTNLLAQHSPYQQGSYSDDFHYVKGQGTDNSRFNNWFYALYPQISPADNWLSFAFNDTSNDCKYCTKLTVKKSPAGQVYYQDSEMFNNVCVNGQQSPNPLSQPPCGSPFPQGRLQNSFPPYTMSNSTADSNALYNPIVVNLGMVNSPYYPSANTAYKLTMRIKADGPTYGTRGWGFWNTQFAPTQASPDYFAWFYEWGINFDFTDTIKSIPLVFPTVLTLNDDSISVTVLLLNAYQWHDYKIIWSANTIEYFVDSILVASHNNPPTADSNHGMAFHNWVDNRLHCTYCGTGTYAQLPMDKSNYIDSLKAEPVFNYKKSTAKPYSLFTVSYPLTEGQKKALSKTKDVKPNANPILKDIIDKLMKDHKKEIVNRFKEKKAIKK